MTVCIAALGQGGIILGAADRMLTAADVQFEPQRPKIYPITSSIVIMTAGDSAFQIEILQDVYRVVIDRINREPENKWLVKDIVNLYADFRITAKQQRAERAVLAPLGLNQQSFINRQHEMAEGFITAITKEILNFDMPGVATIIAGIDNEGSHIYMVNEGDISCWDSVGFAAIGIGDRHASSQFMFAGHSSNSPLVDALLLTYSAKKRAEVAPGVGKETDMFMIGPSFFMINSATVEKLDKEYKKIIKKESLIQKSAREEIERYVDEIQKQANKQAEETSTTDGEKTSAHGRVPINV